METARERFLKGEWLVTVREMLDAGTVGSAAHARRTERFQDVMHVGAALRLRGKLRLVRRVAARLVHRDRR
jgi:hypothetical protein